MYTYENILPLGFCLFIEGKYHVQRKHFIFLGNMNQNCLIKIYKRNKSQALSKAKSFFRFSTCR